MAGDHRHPPAELYRDSPKRHADPPAVRQIAPTNDVAGAYGVQSGARDGDALRSAPIVLGPRLLRWGTRTRSLRDRLLDE